MKKEWWLWVFDFFCIFIKTFVMDTSTLRLDLINKIKSLSDDLVLDIARLIKADEEHEAFLLTDEQNRIIDQSIKDYESGNYITNEVAEAEIQKWLNK